MRHARRGLTLVDVLVAAAIVVILGMTATIVLGRTRETATRVKCASNLRQIGQAIVLYHGRFGQWPRTRYQPETADSPACWTGSDSITPFAATGPLPNDVTAAYRLLLAHEDLVPEVFLCPPSRVADLDYARERFDRTHANFIDERELSYSFANPYPNAQARDDGYKLSLELTAEFAIASDMNRGRSSRGDVLAVVPNDPIGVMRGANSPNHEGDGQNVLYGDGHVEFVVSPFAGVGRDNIFTFGKPGHPAGHGVAGSPAHAADSILLPAADASLWQRERTRRQSSTVIGVAGPTLIVLGILTWRWRASRAKRRPSLARVDQR